MFDFLLDRLAVTTIRRRIRRSPELRADFHPALTVIYRIALPPEEGLLLTSPGRPAHRLHRGLLSYLGIDMRLYWVDGDPMLDFERPAGYACFRGPFLTGWQRVDAPVHIGGRPLTPRGSDPAFTIPIANAAPFYPLLADEAAAGAGGSGGAQAGAGGGVLADMQPPAYPLPPNEPPLAPSEPRQAPEPKDAQGKPCDPVYLAIGLNCHGPSDEESLANDVNQVMQALQNRGYPSASLTAGGKGDSGKALDKLETMIGELPALIDKLGNKRFCHCPTDLLVIFLAAHGYGPGKGPNKGTEVAIAFTPAAGKDTTYTHADVAKLLGEMLTKKGLDPKKVIIIFESCRSGDAFDKGRYGKYMPGVQLICSAPDANHLMLGKLFCFLLSRCLAKAENKSWADILACLKKGYDEYRAKPEWKRELDKGHLEPPKAGRPVQ